MKLKIKVTTVLKGVSLCVFALIFALLCGARALILTDDTLSPQLAQSRWQNGELRYAQISAFMTDDVKFSYNSIRAFRSTLETKLDEASIKADSEDSKLYTDAYSAQGTISASTDRASANSISVTAVGGDFFTIHNLRLLDGSYFQPDDINGDGVVIDDVLSWQLFGSYDVAGLLIYINSEPFTVTGVAAREYGGDFNLAYTDKPHMYMPFDTYARLAGETSVTCYEILIPDPISDFGMKLVKDNLGASADGTVYVENSS
ncbi:MAG: ABC transporter permease, partial [Eubacteriales bacterium]